jgi:hypothetical protein
MVKRKGNITMKAIMGISLLCGMVACLGQPPAPEESSGTSVDSNTSVATAENTLTANDVSLSDHEASDVTAAAQDCVFIQWCDEPPAGGTWKVVGKVRPACFNQCFNDAIINEFMRDARAVCGAKSLDDNKWRIDCF